MTYAAEESKEGFFQITRFGEANQPDAYIYSQPTDFIHAEHDEGRIYSDLAAIAIYADQHHRPLSLVVSVDFYNQRLEGMKPDAYDWDVGAWDREKFYIIAEPTRAGWRRAYQISRGLLNGKTIHCNDGSTITRESYLAGVQA